MLKGQSTILATVLALLAFQAGAVDVTVAYQTSAEPAKVAQADNTFAKESGATVAWRKFDSGAGVLRALASGDVQIGNIGSSPLAVAATQQLPIEAFFARLSVGEFRSACCQENHRQPSGSDWQTHRRSLYLHHALQPACCLEALGN